MAGYDFDLGMDHLERPEPLPDARLFARTSQPLEMLLCWGADGSTSAMVSRNLSFEGALLEPISGHDLPPEDLAQVALRIGDDVVQGEVVERIDGRLRVKFVSIGPGLAEHIYRHMADAPDTVLAERQF